MSSTTDAEELTPEDRMRMEELRPIVEEAVVTVLSAIATDGLRRELRAMADAARERVERSQALRVESDALLERAERVLARR